MLATTHLTALVLLLTGPGLAEAEHDALLRQLDLKRQPWATIPWQASVTEARTLAAASPKPIFLAVNTGNCLGFV